RSNGVVMHLDATARQIILVMKRGNNPTLDAEELVRQGFDKIKAADLFGGLAAYSAGMGGPAAFGELRSVVDNIWDTAWDESFDKVKNLPTRTEYQSPAHMWCQRCRNRKRAGLLGLARVKLLEGIPWWNWGETRDANWERNYAKVLATNGRPI